MNAAAMKHALYFMLCFLRGGALGLVVVVAYEYIDERYINPPMIEVSWVSDEEIAIRGVNIGGGRVKYDPPVRVKLGDLRTFEVRGVTLHVNVARNDPSSEDGIHPDGR